MTTTTSLPVVISSDPRPDRVVRDGMVWEPFISDVIPSVWSWSGVSLLAGASKIIRESCQEIRNATALRPEHFTMRLR